MQEPLSPWQVLLSCFSLASFGGLAQLLRSGYRLRWRNVIAALLYSGLCGLIIGLLWFHHFGGSRHDNHYFLIGVSGLAGVGGVSFLDFVAQIMSKQGFSINIRRLPEDDK